MPKTSPPHRSAAKRSRTPTATYTDTTRSTRLRLPPDPVSPASSVSSSQARRDLERYAGAVLRLETAQHVCRSALQALFVVGYDAETGPPVTEPTVPVDLGALGQFEPRPSNLDRYGLHVLRTSVGSEEDESAVNRETWRPEDFTSASKGLRGLPQFPPGYRLPTPEFDNVGGWSIDEYPDRPQDFAPPPLPSLV